MGFATLPNQVHRKSVKKGFDFTLMVAGRARAGPDWAGAISGEDGLCGGRAMDREREGSKRLCFFAKEPGAMGYREVKW